jgi:hypothetical protein
MELAGQRTADWQNDDSERNFFHGVQSGCPTKYLDRQFKKSRKIILENPGT